MNSSQTRVSGITLRSVVIMIFCLALTTLVTVFLELAEGSGTSGMPILARQSLPLPALGLGAILILLSGLLFAVFKTRFLTRAELICIIFAMLVGLPLVTAGFWMRYLGTAAQTAKGGGFGTLDALNPNLWPHGENLTDGWLSNHEEHTIETVGNVRWEAAEFARTSGVVAMIENPETVSRDFVSAVRITLPLNREDGSPLLLTSKSYLMTLLVKASEIGGNSLYYGRIYYDDSEQFSDEIFATNSLTKPTYLRPNGFSRRGLYDLKFPRRIEKHIVLELALRGPGKVAFADLGLMSVSAIEDAYSGRQIMERDAWEALSENERAGVVVAPAKWLSAEGVSMVARGYIPTDQWIRPTLTFYFYFLLIALGCYAMFSIMRKQWLQNERYPLPVAQIPMSLLGVNEDLEGKALASVWKSRAMWLGFGLAFFWCMMRGFAAYNSSVPDMNINVALKPYFNSPNFGNMWSNVNFTVSALFVGLALFMELNILLSLVIGFFLFRSQYWMGKSFAWDAISGFPYPSEQVLGAYIIYFILIVIFTRRYMWRVVKEAVNGRGALSDADEAMSFRGALIMLGLTIVGSGIWALVVGLPVLPMVVFYIFALAMCFVAAKLRAECGAPTVGVFAGQIAVILPLLGGWAFFKPEGYMFVCMASLVVFSSTLFVIPALELEFIQIARRSSLKYRHLFYALIIGLTGGFFFGGWAVLNTTYALGEEGIGNKLPYLTTGAIFSPYRDAENKADTEVAKEQAGVAGQSSAAREESSRGIQWARHGDKLAFTLAAFLTMVIAVLRQFFAGFWFHPVAIILGPTEMLQSAWGSILMAWFLRFMVLKLGGAVTVRQKLLPFATGVVLAAVAAYAIFGLYAAYLYFFDQGAQTYSVVF